MRRLSRSLVVALALAPLFAATARAQTAAAGETEILRDGLVVVLAENAQLEPDKAKKLVERVKAAYDFVKAEQHWANTDVLTHELAVHVLTDAHMKERHPKAVGFARGPNQFWIGEGFLEKEASDRVLAHELTHLQDRRQLVKKGSTLPHYLLEGRAIFMGLAWSQKLGLPLAKHQIAVARHLLGVSPGTPRRVLRDDADKAEKDMEPAFKRDMEEVGYFFLEYLRTKLGGAGLADVEARLARVVAAVGGGASFEDAFEKEIGTKLAAAQDAFLDFWKATDGKPLERFRGTALEPFAERASKPAPTPAPAATPGPEGPPVADPTRPEDP